MSRSWIGRLLSGALLILAVLGTWWAIERFRTPDKPLPVVAPGVDLSMEGVTFSQGEAGKLLWNLKSKHAEYAQDKGLVRLTEPELTYVPRQDGKEIGGAGEGNGTVRVISPLGEVDKSGRYARLWSGVRISYRDLTVLGEELTYSGDDRDLILTGNVQLLRGGMEMRTGRIIIHLDSGAITADGGVEAVMNNDRLSRAERIGS